MKEKNTIPKFTEQSARVFGQKSMSNYILLRTCLRCGCEPYKDVFTYNRWSAQGFQVRKGEKAIKLPLVKEKEVKDQSSGEVVDTRKIFAASCVFCRCQVDKKEVVTSPNLFQSEEVYRG